VPADWFFLVSKAQLQNWRFGLVWMRNIELLSPSLFAIEATAGRGGLLSPAFFVGVAEEHLDSFRSVAASGFEEVEALLKLIEAGVAGRLGAAIRPLQAIEHRRQVEHGAPHFEEVPVENLLSGLNRRHRAHLRGVASTIPFLRGAEK
jgi:hypothetical protein